jgi:signal transduction histidine kinase
MDSSTSNAIAESSNETDGPRNDMDEARRQRADVGAAHNSLMTLLAIFERERALFGYDIHDGIVQDLVGAMMAQEKALQLLQTHALDSAYRESVRVLTLLRTAVDEARRMINNLRPGALEQLGLVAAIRQLVAESGERYGVECAFAEDVRFSHLAPPLETGIFRIVQEALSNALRHSGSRAVLVTLSQRGHRLCLKVEDWGVGFEPDAVGAMGVGLEGMRQRAHLLEGRLKIRSAPGKGTMIKVKLPVLEKAPAST